MKWNRIAAGCVSCAAALALGACARRTATPPPEAVPVTSAAVERKSVPVEVSAIGHVEAHSTVGVKSQVNGTLMSVGFREGQDVREGDLLFRQGAARARRSNARIVVGKNRIGEHRQCLWRRFAIGSLLS